MRLVAAEVKKNYVINTLAKLIQVSRSGIFGHMASIRWQKEIIRRLNCVGMHLLSLKWPPLMQPMVQRSKQDKKSD